MKNKVPPTAILEIVVFVLIFIPLAYFAGREVFRLFVNLWHHLPRWILITVGVVTVPVVLYLTVMSIALLWVLAFRKKG